MTDVSIYELFETLYKNNKYLITVKDHSKYKWSAYIYKNQHIQIDLQKPGALVSEKIDVNQLLEYIDTTPEIKIKYTCMYDDFQTYNKMMSLILNQIQKHYAENNKNVIISYKTYYD
jgi:hypothetical protein